MSQVKNLRAMFENKGDTSPPDRGRSGASTPSASQDASGTGSPRPLSKIRTNFVAIEKDGKIGLQREPSNDSSGSPTSLRRPSMETDAGSTSSSADKQSVARSDNASQASRGSRDAPIPGLQSPFKPSSVASRFSVKSDDTSDDGLGEELGAITDNPSVNPDKHMDEEEASPALQPIEAPEQPVVQQESAEEVKEEATEKIKEEPLEAAQDEPKTEAKDEAVEINEGVKEETNEHHQEEVKDEAKDEAKDETTDKTKDATKDEVKEKEEVKEAGSKPASAAINGKQKAEKAKVSPTTTHPKTTTVKKTTARPSTISTKNNATVKPAAKSPPATKASTTTARKAEPRTASNVHDRLAVKKEPAGPAKRSVSATRPTTGTTAKKPQPIKPTAHEPSPVKPKPKSPTKPAHLPSSATATTASAASRVGRSTQPKSVPQAGTTSKLSVPGRAPSRASDVGPTGSTDKTIKRQRSNVNRPKPSVGPPPKKPAADHPVTKKEAHVDEGFLARMMRPTQASSSKTSEKAPTTPPRQRATKRPSTAGTDKSGSQRGSSVKARSSSNARSSSKVRSSSQARSASNVRSSSKASARKRAPSTTPSESGPAPIQEVAAETANVETAEEATNLTRETVPETVFEAAPIEEVASETANVETAEAAIELAKEANLVQAPASPEVPAVKIENSEKPTGVEAVADKLDDLSIGNATKDVTGIKESEDILEETY